MKPWGRPRAPSRLHRRGRRDRAFGCGALAPSESATTAGYLPDRTGADPPTPWASALHRATPAPQPPLPTMKAWAACPCSATRAPTLPGPPRQAHVSVGGSAGSAPFGRLRRRSPPTLTPSNPWDSAPAPAHPATGPASPVRPTGQPQLHPRHTYPTTRLTRPSGSCALTSGCSGSHFTAAWWRFAPPPAPRRSR